MPQKTTLCALAVCLAVTSAYGTEPAPKLKGSKKESAPKIDLGMPTFDKPKDIQLQKATEKPPAEAPSPSSDTPYQVVSVVNAKAFTRSGATIRSSPPLESIAARGTPLMTEKFASVIKVRGAGKRGSIITVKVVDSRGDTVMDAEGQLIFHGDEVEWTVEWAPAMLRTPGDCTMQISVAGQQVAALPLKIEAKKE